MIRRVIGGSMLPTLKANTVVIGRRSLNDLSIGDVVIVVVEGREVIKRVKDISPDKVFIIGDNTTGSRDSRSYGWVKIEDVKAKVIWPKV